MVRNVLNRVLSELFVCGLSSYISPMETFRISAVI